MEFLWAAFLQIFYSSFLQEMQNYANGVELDDKIFNQN